MKFEKEFSNVLPVKFCNFLIQKFESDDRREIGKLGSTHKHIINKDFKDCSELRIGSLEDWGDICSVIEKYAKSTLTKYIKECNDELAPGFNIDNIFKHTKIESMAIQKITPGTGYNWHQDTTHLNRIVNCIFYLNTLDNCGETKIINGSTFTPEAGKMLIYPTTWNYFHTGTILKEEPKYIIVFHFTKP